MIRNRPITLPENTFFIYKITCNINNKSYIGLTKNYNKRFEQHLSGSGSKPLLHDLVEYSINKFTFEILEMLNKTRQEAESRERELILFYDCIRNGYNISLGEISVNDDEIDLDNIQISAKCVHNGVFSIPELSNPLSFQKLLNLKEDYNVENLTLKKQFGFKYFQLTLPNPDGDDYIINHMYEFCLSLKDGILS